MKVKSNVSSGRTDTAVGSDGVLTHKELRVSSVPVAPTDVANKAYVDKVLITDKYLAGDILIRPTDVTPTGFLKCNGGELTKTAYPALYAAIGDAHSVYSVPGAGTPWRNQYGINSVLNGPLNDWIAGTSLAVTNMSFQVAITKSRIYIFGRGSNSTTVFSNCYTATIAADGTIGTWTTASFSLPGPLVRSQIFTYLGRLYLVGGHNGNAAASVVYRATINTDGTITSFSTLTALPFTVSDHQCAPVRGKVFLGGGFQNGVASAAIHVSAIDANGNFGTWVNASQTSSIVNFPYAITNHVMCMVNRRGYLIGGLVNGTTATNAIHYSEFDDAGNMSAWKQATHFPKTVYNASIMVSNEKVYIVGGIMNGAYSNEIYFADIRADGSLGTWTLAGNLPDTISSARTIMNAGRIYILGGFKGGTAALSATYYIEMPGGLNDYSPYYNGTIGITAADKFRLPDYTKQLNKDYYFIKY